LRLAAARFVIGLIVLVGLVVVVLGAGVYDRLAELGCAAFGRAIVDGVHFGNRPIEPPSGGQSYTRSLAGDENA
jgi:hypothetical protein